MNQSSLSAPKNAPEPWNFSSTESRFSGEFLLQKIKLLRDWLSAHSHVLSAIVGLIGLLLTGITWGEFQHTLDRNQVHSSEITAATAVASPSSSPLFASSAASATSSAKLRAHIAGAVRKPGVYELPNPSVVQDLVAIAGGLSGLVWQDYLDEYINLAAPLSPNQKVWIPSLTQRELLDRAIEPGLEPGFGTDSSEDLVIAAASESSALSINTASAAELDTLAGIGLKRAEDIVVNRPYTAIDELTSKAGVPASIVTKLKNQLKL